VSRKSEPSAPEPRGLAALLDDYDGILLDAYGVLVDSGGALPGAAALLDELARRATPAFVVTNDASRLPATIARRFADFGLTIAADHVITAGSLLAGYVAAHGLAGARAVVLGTADSRRYAEQAGCEVVALDRDGELDLLMIGDEVGYDFLPALDAALTLVSRQLERGAAVRLVLPNPDVIYPVAGGGFGFTAGGAALLLEAGLSRRLGRAIAFDRLGKPHRPIFDEAVRRAGSHKLLMIGDQLETDIAGARQAGLDAALLETGVSRWQPGHSGPTPTWLLADLALQPTP
jgi:ribonucleotide monophosphatase NagD (HAD superfamily)